jgi:hypothetical protein
MVLTVMSAILSITLLKVRLNREGFGSEASTPSREEPSLSI